jgi:hypothetical protein
MEYLDHFLDILYIKINVCLHVCMELIQIHISEPIWTKLCTRLPLGMEETVGHVWTWNSWPLQPFGPIFFGGHCRIMGTRWLPAQPFSAIPLYPCFQLMFVWHHRHYVVADGGVIRGSLIFVIPAGVPWTSRKWHHSRRQSHPPQRRIPYLGGCSHHVTDITFNRAMGPSATALYPSF